MTDYREVFAGCGALLWDGISAYAGSGEGFWQAGENLDRNPGTLQYLCEIFPGGSAGACVEAGHFSGPDKTG